MSNKHKKACTTLNYIESFLILASAVTGCISISAFASLLGIPTGIMTSAMGLKIECWRVCFNKECAKRIWYERRNKKFKDLNSSLKVQIYLENKIIILFSKRRIDWKYVITL